MKQLALVASFLALLCAPAFADLEIVRKVHTDATKMNGQVVPAKDSKSTLWLAKDRLHIVSDENTAIVRLDQKKLILLDEKAKTWTAIDLPFDLKKYVPPEAAGMIDQMLGGQVLDAKVEPKDEEQKFGEWSAKRYEITLSKGTKVFSKEIVWTTKDLKSDISGFNEMYSSMMTMNPAHKQLGPELKKLQGFPVHSEKTQSLPGGEQKTIEDLVSATEKEAPAGIYDVPAGYKEKPFDPMGDAGGMPGGR
ncbi:MAG: DUF4412 domain-containing protein [Planctomycetes bacterium]|nr:DUF4412 domain-containing protein [Planctomycetota bacterium]